MREREPANPFSPILPTVRGPKDPAIVFLPFPSKCIYGGATERFEIRIGKPVQQVHPKRLIVSDIDILSSMELVDVLVAGKSMFEVHEPDDLERHFPLQTFSSKFQGAPFPGSPNVLLMHEQVIEMVIHNPMAYPVMIRAGVMAEQVVLTC